MTKLKDKLMEAEESAVHSVQYHLNSLQSSIGHLIKVEKELSEFKLNSYDIKWLEQSKYSIVGHKGILQLAGVKEDE
jgi:myosin-crossreactive antigen